MALVTSPSNSLTASLSLNRAGFIRKSITGVSLSFFGEVVDAVSVSPTNILMSSLVDVVTVVFVMAVTVPLKKESLMVVGNDDGKGWVSFSLPGGVVDFTVSSSLTRLGYNMSSEVIDLMVISSLWAS